MSIVADLYRDNKTGRVFALDKRTNQVFLVKPGTVSGLGAFDWVGLTNALMPTVNTLISGGSGNSGGSDQYQQIAQSVQLQNQQIQSQFQLLQQQQAQQAESTSNAIKVIGFGVAGILVLTVAVTAVKRAKRSYVATSEKRAQVS